MGMEPLYYCNEMMSVRETRNIEERVGLEDVERYWSGSPCGSDQSTLKDRKRYFEEIEQRRYSHERHILDVARFSEFKGQRVLEVGCGIGTDGVQFARNGALYTGINLDEGSTVLARECFEMFGMPGRLLKMNAEHMEFPANTFDHVYSFGVIHHSPDPERIVAEIFRVLKPGGTVTSMLYNRSSINYYVEIMFLRKIFRYALLPSFAPRLIAKIVGLSAEKLARHREILLSEKMTPARWVSINTDGPECPLARVYSRRQALSLFHASGFLNVKTYVRFFNTDHYGFIGKLIPNLIAVHIGRFFGWHRLVEAIKQK